jgi:hypothetical protein
MREAKPTALNFNALREPKGTIMKSMIGLLAFVVALSAPAFAADPPAQSMHFTNGATATSYDHCGDMDLCAKIAYDNGSNLSIYSEGAALCQPYFLHFVFSSDGKSTQYEFSRALNHTIGAYGSCGHTVSTEMVLDRGFVHMLVTENPDGTLTFAFSVAKQ